jgi:CMP-N-acetylneuraminic acid synthetase
MNCICCLPVKSRSSRVPRKNFQPINGTPLYIRTIEKLKSSSFDLFYVDSDSCEIAQYCSDNSIPFVYRAENLASDNANGNDLILDSIERFPGFNYYFQVFATAPFLSVSSIDYCIAQIANVNFDSVFTVKEKTTWYWSKKGPINYDPCQLPRSQDVDKVYYETTGLYGVSRNTAIERRCRIGYKPFMYEVSELEAIDIDTQDDLDFARVVDRVINSAE